MPLTLIPGAARRSRLEVADENLHFLLERH